MFSHSPQRHRIRQTVVSDSVPLTCMFALTITVVQVNDRSNYNVARLSRLVILLSVSFISIGFLQIKEAMCQTLNYKLNDGIYCMTCFLKAEWRKRGRQGCSHSRGRVSDSSPDLTSSFISDFIQSHTGTQHMVKLSQAERSQTHMHTDFHKLSPTYRGHTCSLSVSTRKWLSLISKHTRNADRQMQRQAYRKWFDSQQKLCATADGDQDSQMGKFGHKKWTGCARLLLAAYLWCLVTNNLMYDWLHEASLIKHLVFRFIFVIAFNSLTHRAQQTTAGKKRKINLDMCFCICI